MATAMWKLEKDLCRCCHAEGSFKNLAEPCFQLGQEEIYFDMLQESLDIKIVPITGVLGEVTYTICESCIVRLRDACNFKRQVQDCEERFKDMYSRNLIRAFEVKEEPVTSEPEDMKQELQSMDDDDDDAFLNFDASEDDMDDSALSVTEELEPRGKGKGKAKPKPKPKPKQPVKKKTPKKTIKEETEVTEAAVSGEKKKGLWIEVELRDHPYASIIKDGDAQKYNCRECNTTLKNYNSLKLHFRNQHIRVKCPVCDEELESVIMRRRHLLKIHNLEEVVGKGKNKELKEKEKNVCGVCKKDYTTKKGLAKHISLKHALSKCPDCPSMFTEKELPFHRNDVHGTPMPTCGVCGYRNVEEKLMLEHQRQVHIKERTVPCEFCDLTFFSTKYLRKHMITHKPERIHECSYCHKKFPRKNTLYMHEKIHKGVKNKVCAVCGERFVQKASLNYHMLKHHPDAC